MATQDKFNKSLEALRQLSGPNQVHDPSRNKDKIQHCHVITDSISNCAIQVSANFPKTLSYSVEMLLKLCDDQDSDIRMVAEECLNRIIRNVGDEYMCKIHIELYNEIRRNGPAKSLRAGLLKFSQLCHLIRPQKGKPYVESLFPSLVKVAERAEEQVHDTLAVSLVKIMKTLGCFASDNEIKILLKSFLANISNQSAVIRRTSSTSLLSICINCRKPYQFLGYCINNLLDLIIPIKEDHPSQIILGIMTALKTLLPKATRTCCNKKDQNCFDCETTCDNAPVTTEKLLQIYELCLFYLKDKDHNVVNSSLECLNILLVNCTNNFREAILSKQGVERSRITSSKSLSLLRLRSPSLLSVATNSFNDENLFQETELTDSLHCDIEKWIDQSKLSVSNITYAKTKDLEKSQSLESSLAISSNDLSDSEYNEPIGKYQYVDSTKSNSFGDNLDVLTNFSENSSEKSASFVAEDKELEIGDFLDRDISLLYCTRLITKQFLLNGQTSSCIPDKVIRVSVKSQALNCLTTIVKIYPQFLLQNLSKNDDSKQEMCDLLLYGGHADPHLRGLVRVLTANFLQKVLIESQGDYEGFLKKFHAEKKEFLQMNYLMELFLKGLEDESSNCIKQTLFSLKTSLPVLLNSFQSFAVRDLFIVIPLLAKNPYWLVKVELCELIATLSYVTIYFVTNNSDFQNQALYNILFNLLNDNDQRVRSCAANSIVLIIPNLYFEQSNTKETVVSTKVASLSNKLLRNLNVEPNNDINLSKKHFINSMPFPYKNLNEKKDASVAYSLSKVVQRLYSYLLSATSKNFICGCIETLSLLSNQYPSTSYSNSWLLTSTSDKHSDLLSLTISLLNSTTISYDLSCQINLLNLSSNLFAGQSILLLQPITDLENSKMWEMFISNTAHCNLSEEFLHHIVKLLSIFYHILKDLTPWHAQSKPVLQNFPSASSLSPIKRRKSDLDKKMISPGKVLEKTDKKTGKTCEVSSFFQFPHYMKIYEILKGSYTNYKVSLESSSSEKLLLLLKTVLSSLSVLLEVATLTEFGRVATNVLNYLLVIFELDATSTVECVQQLLKCLLGTNLTANLAEILRKNPAKQEAKLDGQFGFYYNIFQKPYSDVSNSINLLKNLNRIECDGDCTVMGYLHRRNVKKQSVLSKSSEKVLKNYIKIFEPIIIKSLKQYIITSNVQLQCKVLQLLSQLLRFCINYCLLDNEEVMKGFVLKQFDFISCGQIAMPEDLIAKIFQFLVQLSHNKHHSKLIIEIPKIIQLCDDLLASEQSPLTHCIPALQPIVEDVFLVRNKSNTNNLPELETTREVVLVMLLRLCDHHEVINLISLILEDSKYCGDQPDKWLKWSKQIVSSIFPLLKSNKIRLENSESFESFRRFILTLNPQVFGNVNELVLMFFQEPPGFNETFTRWASKVVILLIILTPLKEEVLLQKIEELKKHFSPKVLWDKVQPADPLNVSNNFNGFDALKPEEILHCFIFRVVEMVSKECLRTKNEFLVELLSMFLTYCVYIFQSGSHCKLTKVAIEIIQKNKDIINLSLLNQQFFELSAFYPNLTFYWCYLLTLLNYSNVAFWKRALLSDLSDDKLPFINLEITKIGGAIVFCDYLSESTMEPSLLEWLLQNHIKLLVDLSNEAPVYEFIASINRNEDLSKVFLDHIQSQCLTNNNTIFQGKLLKCVENTHTSQVGILLQVLLPKMLNCRKIAFSRQVANLASRKIELLLTLPVEEVHDQLSKESLMEIKASFLSRKQIKKHEALISLINKLAIQFYDLSPLEFDQRRLVKPSAIKQLEINKNWFLSQIQNHYHDSNTKKETAMLLNRLEYNEIISFMSCSDFNKSTIKDCIFLGVDLIKKNNLKHEPTILQASIDCLLKDLGSINNMLPKPHQVYSSYEREASLSEEKYSKEIDVLFGNEDFFNLLHSLAPSVAQYVKSLAFLPYHKLPEDALENITKFSVICLESISFLLDQDKSSLNIDLMDSTVGCADVILKNPELCGVLSLDCNILWFCSVVNCIFKLIAFLLRHEEPLPCCAKYGLKEALEGADTRIVAEACYQLNILVSWLYKINNSTINVPEFLLSPLQSIVVSLARLACVNSYVLIPGKVWNSGWKPGLLGSFATQVPALPIEFLQEIDVLEEFIFRITLLGWTSRQQFEETWMCLLSVLCTPTENLDSAELNDVVHASSLAVQAITSLLLQTLEAPVAGNSNVSELIHVSRDVPIDEQSLAIRKLKEVQKTIEDKYLESYVLAKKDYEIVNVFTKGNFEKTKNYSFGQISVRYFLIASRPADDWDGPNVLAAKVFQKREKILMESGLDVNSCLQFLIDYYTQLMKPNNFTNMRLLLETVRSTVRISDLFNDKSQFLWMLEVFLELSKLHLDNELMLQYLIVGICKSAAVISPDLEIYEQIKKLLVQHLQSSFLPARLSCLHGLLYLLEGCILNNITIGGISEEMQLLLPCAVEYIQKYSTTTNSILKKSKEHTHLIWSLAFYIIENVDEQHIEKTFFANILQSAFNLLQQKFNTSLHKAIIKGLERLVIVHKAIRETLGKHVLKLALDKLKHDNPVVSVRGLQLLLSYMYSDCREHLEQNASSKDIQTNPDYLVQTIEKVSAIFERIKKGFIVEVEILCGILPNILHDFFTPSDVLTKVIGEFLSPQQPHPKHLSKVVFQVIEDAIEQHQLTLLQDWVVYSLSNFTQSFSIGMATWCLTCFFLSASSNEWLRSLFPYIQTRVGRYEYEDRKMFCIAGLDFYQNLNADQQQMFVESFRKAQDLPDKPFNDLLSSL